MDAAAVRKGRDLAMKAGRTFGFGWVLKALQERAAARMEARPAAAAMQPSTTPQASDASQAEEDRARREYFAALPAAVQAEWRSRAASGPLVPSKPAVLDAIAAGMAWKNREARQAATAA